MCTFDLVAIQKFFKSNIALSLLIFAVFALVTSTFMAKITKPLVAPVQNIAKYVDKATVSWVLHLAVASIVTLVLLNIVRKDETLQGNAGKSGKNLPGFF